MEQIVIKEAGLQDVKTLAAIGRETFSETFAGSNTAGDMQKYLDTNFTEGKITAEVTNPDSLFFIVWADNEPVGYLKLNTGSAQTELQDNDGLEIERIYVKSAYHGKKAGQALYQKAEEVARAKSRLFIWLGVWEENPKAIRFYEKNGFMAFGSHIFKMGEDEQTDIMMKKQL